LEENQAILPNVLKMLNALTVVSCRGSLKKLLRVNLHNYFGVLMVVWRGIDFFKSDGILIRIDLHWIE